jgi:esterase/lipase
MVYMILASHPHPVQSYGAALQRITALRAPEPDMNPECHLRLMTYDRKVAHAIIFVHGYTNCPQQFAVLGQRFYDLGYNVLIAPLKYNGLADHLSQEHARLTAEDLVQYADEVVDIAQGLGDKVDIAGLSVGGIITSYAAQYRQDVNLAVIMAPAFGVNQIPAPLTGAAANLFSILPNWFVWWDQKNKDEGGIDHAYPRFSTRAIAQTIRLGFAVRADARRQAPAAARLLVITNANDNAVNRPLIASITNAWRQHGANLSTYEFTASLKLEHDFIDSERPGLPIELVYSKLIELMTK